MDKKKIKNLIILFLLAVTCLSLCSCGKKNEEIIEIEELVNDETDQEDSETNQEEEVREQIAEDTEDEYIYVHVCGAVEVPGVYSIKKPARVYEALELAGGITDDGLEEVINQAREVVDGEQIYIPTVEEKENGLVDMPSLDEKTSASDGRININMASLEELMTLPGIGQSKASAIIDYRESNGKFGSVEDIMNIEGIKEGVFNKIKDKISI